MQLKSPSQKPSWVVAPTSRRAAEGSNPRRTGKAVPESVRPSKAVLDDKLPDSYDRALFTEKCNIVFDTMLNYASQGVKVGDRSLICREGHPR
jgi:hypothetical protein